MISLNAMAELARALCDAETAVASAEAVLRDRTERARELREETIPAAMQELGLMELRLDTGQKLTVRQDVYAAIPEAHKGAAFAWMTEHGFDGLIKTDVVQSFGRGDRMQAALLAAHLADLGWHPVCTEKVHPQTLKAFLREQIAAGHDVPLELFGARPVWVARVSNT